MKVTHEAESSASRLLTQQEYREDHEWLSHQFSRIPFLLYKYWLLLNIPIILISELYMISWLYKESFKQGSPRSETRMAIGFMFPLLGCCEMFYAITKKNSKITQEAFLKFQYAVISSVALLETMTGDKLTKFPLIKWLQWFYVVSSGIHLLGGFAVLKVFKKNHPLARLHASQALEEVGQDFLEQNEAIASELSNYDKQLSRWLYFIYKWLLRFSVIFELIYAFQYALPYLYFIWEIPEDMKEDFKINFSMILFLIGWWISSLLNAYSCFQMEIAMRTRNLAKSNRAIVLLKICTVLSVIKGPFVGKCIDLDKIFDRDLLLWYLGWFACSALIPVFGLGGALKVKKIIEERENFVKVSSYSEDTYI